MLRISFMLALIAMSLTTAYAEPSPPQQRDFTEFSVLLPTGWDGNERAGFVSNNKDEYMLTLGLKDAEEEQYLAYISLYLLPNKPGKTSQETAQALAHNQAEASEPVQEGPFWVFTGNPRDTILKGMAKTLVRANAHSLLIIVVKDPNKLGATKILQSLIPRSDRAKALLHATQS